ncbi:hypothetical protein CNYM01_10880 [Colletotrichum nymphaeae SA-01]|uniref:Uncharacterized protein n=1 Tax=Colletotrichum nymphaeae SA-01 TaxID=1460502 RepID=A0A135S6J3_9PEZI|nr:hypothetical protein CNYM01_10880 [Colletotrichum nymphaeae SA-01]
MDYLFKTTDSVIEILWDVALAFFVVRIALSYFFFTFTATTLLSWIVYTYRQSLRLPLVSDQQQQYITTSQSDPLVLAVLLLLQTVVGLVVARYVVAVYDVPRVAWFRLAIGGLAVAFLASTEGLLGLVISAFLHEGEEHGRDFWVWESGNGWVMVAAMFGGLAAFAAMPAVLMWFERSEKAPASAGRAEGREEMGTQGLDGKGL